MTSACTTCGERRASFRRCVCGDLDVFHRDGHCARCNECRAFRPNGERLTVHEHIAVAANVPT